MVTYLYSKFHYKDVQVSLKVVPYEKLFTYFDSKCSCMDDPSEKLFTYFDFRFHCMNLYEKLFIYSYIDPNFYCLYVSLSRNVEQRP